VNHFHMDDSCQVTVAAAVHCQLGECPVWDTQKRCVYWTDITAGEIFRLDLASAMVETIYQDAPVGGFALQQNGELLLFRVNVVALLHPDGSITVAQTFVEKGMTRFNDVIADPEGRVFAGTIGKSEESGGLYRLDPNGQVKQLFAGTGCANGMGFSIDRKTFYWTCSTSRRIFQFDYDKASGELANRRLLFEAKPGDGIPDGLAVDAEGCIWSAHWAGSAVVRHAPNGKVLGRIRLPVQNVTSVCFGGEDLDQLFITSAQNDDSSLGPAGALFRTHQPVRGSRMFRSRLGMD
jgi:D-xylono/L-arabinono-1,4-lactonase